GGHDHRGSGRGRQAAPAPGRLRRRGRRAVRVLHARDPDERLGPLAKEPEPDARRDRACPLREPVPLHRLHQDLRSGGARGRAPARRPMSRQRPGTPGIPKDRMMPAERRLTPPEWPGGRAAPPNREFHVIGKRNRKVEGLAKVTGRAVYADDITLPRMLHGKLLRSPHAHARIRSIDAAAARALPGVHAVITGQDLPEYYGIIPWTQDEQALCEEKARYVGDAVAAVAADSELIAEEALKLIRVDYEVLPAITS